MRMRNRPLIDRQHDVKLPNCVGWPIKMLRLTRFVFDGRSLARSSASCKRQNAAAKVLLHTDDAANRVKSRMLATL